MPQFCSSKDKVHTSVLVVTVMVLIFLSASFHDWDNGKTKAYHQAIAFIHRNDYPQALQSLTRLAADGDCAAQFRLGSIYEYGFGVAQDIHESQVWYRIAAQHGYVPAQQRIKVISDEFARSLHKIKKSADSGSVEGQLSLAIMYMYGLGVSENLDQCRLLYRKLVAVHQTQPGNKQFHILAWLNFPVECIGHERQN